jgi:apolipoprotein N-acyltransferase
LPSLEPTRCDAGALRAWGVSGVACDLAGRLAHLAGWQRLAAAFLAGLASVTAIAPFHAWPVLYLSLPALIWLLDGASVPPAALKPALSGRTAAWRRLRACAAVGWWFGFGYFVAGLYWVGDAFLF